MLKARGNEVAASGSIFAGSIRASALMPRGNALNTVQQKKRNN
jgi:hypothetical protein